MSERGWQPIETAPKDGKPVLCWPRDDEHATVSWSGDRWRVDCCGQTHYDITHWMPLPLPPSAAPAPPDTEEWLRRLLKWCRPRLKHASYQTWLDKYLAAGPSPAPEDEPPIVHSEAPALAPQDAEARARAALDKWEKNCGGLPPRLTDELLAEFATAITAAVQVEREACAQLCDDQAGDEQLRGSAIACAAYLADAIRARSAQP